MRKLLLACACVFCMSSITLAQQKKPHAKKAIRVNNSFTTTPTASKENMAYKDAVLKGEKSSTPMPAQLNRPSSLKKTDIVAAKRKAAAANKN